MDELYPGDEIWLSTPIGDFLYQAAAPPDGYRVERDRSNRPLAAWIRSSKAARGA